MTPPLLEMLRYRRPARSITEESFISKYIDTVPGMFADEYGNRILLGDSRTMISCHTDTVHKVDGLQRVFLNPKGIITLSKRERISNCLGADDTAGIYAALCMIEAGVDATYIFHRDEEIGGKGSDWMAAHHAEWLESSFDHCIALDRRGTTDIIVNQLTGDCCSDTFAQKLGAALGMGHKPEWGTFTDSANYVNLIRECTNISVGYECEHSSRESLDTKYLAQLVKKLVKIDFSDLPSVRSFLSQDSYDLCEYCSVDLATVLIEDGSFVCQGCAYLYDEADEGNIE